ncbi:MULTISPECIES: hypothetical protein [Aeromonas]|uniref:hypothetical protein n=1 Tax=Aeromonas TaxID=642 RepID=UPI001C20FBDB|nr:MULTISPECIES: hypothetical protein [Aeromonas]MDX7771191.1 hypothetical protein [Aeromonas caviae]QWZ54743.1 hypothetical protein I6L32_02490 [Aeromonas sp. FDAARGOS 1402]
MNIDMMYGVLIISWWVLLVLVVIEIRHWLAEVPEEEDGLAIDEPRLVSACRELSELAAKAKEVSHG